MNDPLEPSPLVPSSPRRFQFSLRTLFIFSFCFIIFSAGIFSHYDVVRYFTLLVVLMVYPIVMLALAIYAKGYLRSFGIGASLTFLPFFLFSGFIFLYAGAGLLVFAQGGATISPATPADNDSVFGKTSTMEDGIAYFAPCIILLATVFCSSLLGGTMVVTRWLIDRSRNTIQANRPAAVPPPYARQSRMNRSGSRVKRIIHGSFPGSNWE
jgi:hypothetical protein